MKVIAAGNNTRGFNDVCMKYDHPKLHSFLNEKGFIEKWDDRYSLMVDSGAHSWNKETINSIGMKGKKVLKPAQEFMATYLDFIRQQRQKKMVFVEFDVYGHLDKKLIDDFYHKVQALNISGVFMRVYHPMLDGGDLSVMKEWIAEGHKYIGIGNDSTEILREIFTLTRDKVKIHGFAMTKIGLMEKFPFYSVDSTSALSTIIFGRYSIPQMTFKERAEVIEEKSIECFHDDWERLENAIIELQVVQKYMTQLWAKKGIVWDE